MGMQVRVRHVLGSRLIDIEARDADRPIRVGRSADCDIRVPVGTVAPTHCVLYMHEGQWVLQDGGSPWGTYVNEHRTVEPVYVKSGDVITLGVGTTAPRIELDPMGGGRPTGSGAVRPAVPTLFAPSPQPKPTEPQPVTEDPSPEQADDYWPLDQQTSALGSSPRRRMARKRGMDQGTFVAIGVVIAAMLILAAWLTIHQIGIRREAERARQTPQPATAGPAGGQKSIFDFPPEPAQRMPATPTPSARIDRSDNVAPAHPAEPADPRKQEEAWKLLMEARDGDDMARLIWTIEDYRTHHPGEFEAELRQYLAEALDRLWWDRIRELDDTRRRLAAEMADLDLQIAAETEAEHKAKLQKERQRLEGQRAMANGVLTADMGFSGEVAPNIADPGQLSMGRIERDRARYEAWAAAVLRSVKTTRRLPWQGR